MAVRANAEVETGLQYHQVDEPAFYEDDFFAELSKAMALTATQDGSDGAVPLPDSIYSDPKS
jgi:hypothetical protein